MALVGRSPAPAPEPSAIRSEERGQAENRKGGSPARRDGAVRRRHPVLHKRLTARKDGETRFSACGGESGRRSFPAVKTMAVRGTGRFHFGIEKTAAGSPITRAKPLEIMKHIGEISIAARQRISGICVTLTAGNKEATGAEAKRPEGSAGLTAADRAFCTSSTTSTCPKIPALSVMRPFFSTPRSSRPMLA